MRRWLAALLILAGIAAGITLGGLNPDTVEVDLLVVRFSGPLGMLLAGFALGGLVGGFVIGMLAGRIGRSRGRSNARGETSPGHD